MTGLPFQRSSSAGVAVENMVVGCTLFLILATRVAAVEAGQCDAATADDPSCQDGVVESAAATKVAPPVTQPPAGEGVTLPPSDAGSMPQKEGPKEALAQGDILVSAPGGSQGKAGNKVKREVDSPLLSASRAGLVLVMLSGVLFWIGAVLKFAIDGSLPARLAIWGFLPEVCAAVSVSALSALLRLKTHPTPAIVLKNCVTDKNAGQLAEAMVAFAKSSELQVVELPFNPGLGKDGLRVIVEATMTANSQVSELDISYNPQLGDEVVDVLRPMLASKVSKVQILKLAGCGLSHSGLERLAQAATKSNIRTLDLSRNELGGASEPLAELCEAPLLEELVLSCCGLKAADVRAIAEQLPYTSIRSLQLNGNDFGCPGAVALAEYLPTSLVDELGLESCEITTEALSPLGTAWAKRHFSRLSLRGNCMTQEEVQSFIRTLKSMNA
eukprot:TRINITY_DN27426_c0_g1_i1.p1 TRINITY_DN27426_c0_g1~~TRINITY_DN27426_c0_g1_i1.p1  ORF type:complete len:443 (+),score=89.87 TRINITY_DN27426_c0_g1_i1:53-1381(+)